MSAISFFVWVALPYLSIAVFVVGHVWRWRHDQFGWAARSTQILERRLLGWGSRLFHFGLAGVFGGHVLGILVPKAVTTSLGISEETYHLISVTAGSIAGSLTVVGLGILLYRRLRVPRVAATTTNMDLTVYGLLTIVMALGMYEVIGVNWLGGGYDYRETVAVWFRGLFTFDPRPDLMASAPLSYQAHAIAAWLLYALWPFSRLVHVWTFPMAYVGRSPILYRGRASGRRSRAVHEVA